jgi:cell division protein ZapA
MPGKDAKTTVVEIYGATYHVRGDRESGRLKKLAALVDRRMHEIARHMSSPDAAKVAILAALNLAEELAEAQQEQEGERVKIQEKVTELAGELESALTG